jgi:hypothetical protein
MLVDILNIIGEFAGLERDYPDGLAEIRLRFTDELDIVYEERVTLWGAMVAYYPQQDPEEYLAFGVNYMLAREDLDLRWGSRILTYEQVCEEYEEFYIFGPFSWTTIYLYEQAS